MAEQHTKSPNAPAQGAGKTHSSPEKKSHNGNGWDWPLAMGNLPEAMQAQTAAWFSGQNDLFAGMQDLMAERTKRFQDGTAAAIQSFERLCACKNGADALSVYHEWLASSMGFFMADLAAMQEQSNRMTQMSQRTFGALSPAGTAASS